MDFSVLVLTTILCGITYCVKPGLAQYDGYESDGPDDEDDVKVPRAHLCPEVKPMEEFNIFKMLGSWYVVQYYSSAEEALTYHCMRVHFNLSRGNMDMLMRLTYRYADDPNDESQAGNITWQIPDPRRPEHWRHTEDHYTGVYNTDVVDTDYENWLLLLHCSDPESNKKFLSTFILGRRPHLDPMIISYLREKVGQFDVDLEYLFPVNQTHCQTSPTTPRPLRIGRQITTTAGTPRKKKSRRSRERLG